MRRQNLIFYRESMGKLENLKEEYMKLISDREKAAAADLQQDSEEDWEDVSEEPVEEEVKRDLVM